MDERQLSRLEDPSDSTTDGKEVEGKGHVSDDERSFPEQQRDELGLEGPSYEREQVVHGKEVHPGGSVSPNSNRSHASGTEDGE